MNEFMKLAKEESIKGIKAKEGGPFGAVIVDSTGKVIAVGHNRVLASHDPTAHAEVETIRAACERLQTHDLSGYTLYTSCEPCPMCLSAAIWANIKTIYYGCTRTDAKEIGFRDDMIYEYLKGNYSSTLEVIPMDRQACLEAFQAYQEENGEIY